VEIGLIGNVGFGGGGGGFFPSLYPPLLFKVFTP